MKHWKKRNELAKWYRKAKPEDFRKRINEIGMELVKLNTERHKEGSDLKDKSNSIRNFRRELAILKTIAREREMKI